MEAVKQAGRTFFKPSGKKRAQFYRQVVTMLEAGVSITRIFETLQRSFPNPSLRDGARQILEYVRDGHQLSDAMSKTGLFPELEVSLVKGGEYSGRTEKALAMMAQYLESATRLTRTIIAKIIYPLVILHIALFVPGFVKFFLGKVSLFAYLFGTLWQILEVYAILFGMYLGIRWLRKNETTGAVLDLLVLCMPGIGGYLRSVALAKYSMCLRSLYEAGISLRDGLRIAGEACGNRFIARRMSVAQRCVDEGKSLVEAFESADCFPKEVVAMVETGEESGKLDAILAKIQQYSEDEVQFRGQRLSIYIYFIVLFVYFVIMITLIMQMFGAYVSALQ